MAFTKINLREEVKAQLQDDAVFIVDTEIDKVIGLALRHLNRDSPFTKIFDITGDTTQSYDIETPGFVKGFSNVSIVEFPADETPPVFPRKKDEWIVYEDPSETSGERIRLRFINRTPDATQSIRVTMEIPHTIDESTSTLDDNAFAALVYKTIVLALRALSNRFIQTTDSSLAADSVDYAGRPNLYLFVAERFETSYKEMAGLTDDVKAAQAIGEADIRYPSGEDYYWHPVKLR